MTIPKKGKIYSINEGNGAFWDEPVKEYVNNKKFPGDNKDPYSLRY
jgi:fructose-1,6-bisphosphatase I